VKILIIDDDEDLRNLLAHYLKQEWPEVQGMSRSSGSNSSTWTLGGVMGGRETSPAL
jgi:DNA-binding response OmpR family regulator